MKHIEIDLSGSNDDGAIEQALESACLAAALDCTMKNTLRTFSGSIHWHFKRGTQPGTLELTFWPREHRAWFSIHPGRKADWIERTIPLVADQLRATLHG